MLLSASQYSIVIASFHMPQGTERMVQMVNKHAL